MYQFIFSINISSDKESIQNAELILLNNTYPLTKVGNTYSTTVDIPSDVLNQDVDYTVVVYEKLPVSELYEGMPLSMYVDNTYTVTGKVKFRASVRKDYFYCKRMFIKLTGRYDLVANPIADDYSDIYGLVSMYFNTAQKYLDDLFDIEKMKGFYYYQLPANEYIISLSNIRYVKNVWEVKEDSDGNKYTERIDYYPIASGFVPEQCALESSEKQIIIQNTGLPAELLEDNFPVKYIYIQPKNEDRHILIETFYYSKELIRDEDITFWTMIHPELLVRTAVMVMERYNKNYNDALTLEQGIIKEVLNISKDYIASEISAIPHYNMCMR